MLTKNFKPLRTDEKFTTNLVSDINFENHNFVRLVATKVRFVRVNFNYAILDACYLRACTFDSCTFVGCRFTGTNTHGSSFIDCNFNYCTFEKTQVSSEIFDCAPHWHNVRRAFARTLRLNFQQLGDAESANTAILIELEATRMHLLQSWASPDPYFRSKYAGLERFFYFCKWVWFEILKFIWGNGESALNLVRTFVLIFVLMAIADVHYFRDPRPLSSYGHAIVAAPEIFFGVVVPQEYPKFYLLALTLVRLISFGFLTSIILKRANRR